MVYFSGGMMALVGLVFIITHSLVLVLAAGALFGIGYGACTSVDWAVVADVLPSHRNFARDMGVWNISLSLPQVIAPIVGGPLIDAFTRSHQPVLGFQLLFAIAVVYCLIGTATVRFIRGGKRYLDFDSGLLFQEFVHRLERCAGALFTQHEHFGRTTQRDSVGRLRSP